ncbi:hypothetical protein SAMN06264849_10568 [Melghirimyces algeriensis]|uniref:Uncharacterized protein n=1 Tax=Melghirimyces algeriensis TaxID=910412 RepID=A0A521D1Y5_9BACL|nr:hypothetical protein SAMN06264849_10568 [Melghirimyces algeriensis]
MKFIENMMGVKDYQPQGDWCRISDYNCFVRCKYAGGSNFECCQKCYYG